MLITLCGYSNLYSQWHKRDLRYASHHLFDYINPSAVHFSSPDNGYVIGNDIIMHFDGTKWLPVLADRKPGWLSSVFTVNDRITFFGGGRGLLFKCDNNTITYYKNIDSTIAVKCIYMIDSANGWATGAPGKMYKITGNSATYYPFDVSTEICGISFDAPNHGWAVAYYGPDMYDSSYAGIVYEYKNGDWQYPSIVIPDKLNAITTTPAGVTYIAGNKSLYTINKQTNTLESVPNTQGFPIQSVSMANDSFGVATGKKNYLIFSNGKWQSFKAEYNDIQSAFCVNNEKIWSIYSREIVDLNNIEIKNTYDVPKTNNPNAITYLQGNKWIPYPLNYLDTVLILPFDNYILSVAGLGKKHLRINGDPINIPPDKDWADTIPVLDGFNIGEQVKIIDKNTAWSNITLALNYYHNDTITIVEPLNMGQSPIIAKMHMFDDMSAFLIFQQFDSTRNDFIGYFKNNNIEKTYTISDKRQPIAIHFSDRNTGWVVGDSGLIIKYNHSNDSWESVASPVKEPLFDVFSIDENNAWSIGINGTMLKWDGTSWSKVTLNIPQQLFALYFTDKDHGWAVGRSGIVMKYKEGAWSKDTTLGNADLYTIYMVDKNYGWTGGSLGSVFQYINTDTAKSGRTATTETFSSISPNPVTSQASIQFNIALKGNAYIKIYDQAGHLYSTYNLGTVDSGVHSYKIQTSNLLSGIYIYHIISSSGEKGSGRFIKAR